jgi:hypothetical protein
MLPERRRPYVPETVRAYYRDPISLSNAPFAIIALGASLWLLGWWGLLVAVFATTVALVMRVWGEASTLDEELRDTTAKLNTASEDRLELQQEVDRLEAITDGLRRRVAQPELGLPHLLYALKRQIEEIELVQKHRQMHGSGIGDFPVMTASASDLVTVRVTAHAEATAGLAGEPVFVVDRAADRPISRGTAVSIGEGSVEVEFPFIALPEMLQEQVLDQGELDPGNFVLRLLGLGLPDAELSDRDLEALQSQLKDLTSTVAGALGAGRDRPLQLEEGT